MNMTIFAILPRNHSISVDVDVDMDAVVKVTNPKSGP